MVGGGKGGVGKSLVACGLALRLAARGLKVGLLDLDVHGASVPAYLGLKPPLSSDEDGLVPATSGGVRAMSVGLLVGQRPVPLRGSEKESLVSWLFSLTHWGPLDFLVVDLPPGLGDEVLSSFGLFSGKGTLTLVTTPSPAALRVVGQLAELARMEKVPVEGVVLNMSWLGEGSARAWPFGRLEAGALGRRLGTKCLAEVPLDPAVSEKPLAAVLGKGGGLSRAFDDLSNAVGRQPAGWRAPGGFSTRKHK